MIVIFGALALTVGAVASLALESWWILVGVMAVHAIASAVVVAFTLRQTDKDDKPDPVTAARIEEEGTSEERDRMHREALGS